MQTVYTIGYEGTDISRFIATLQIIGIKVLADVRAVAISRKKGFSKSALKAHLQAGGIGYVHLSALGDPKPGRVAARAGNVLEFQKIYTSHLATLEAKSALSELYDIVDESPTCLLCFEHNPISCHRSIVADRLKTKGVEVFHLFGDDPGRYVRNSIKLPRRHIGEGAPATQ